MNKPDPLPVGLAALKTRLTPDLKRLAAHFGTADGFGLFPGPWQITLISGLAPGQLPLMHGLIWTGFPAAGLKTGFPPGFDCLIRRHRGGCVTSCLGPGPDPGRDLGPDFAQRPELREQFPGQ